jgi:Spy/CpxP family protein refolding chaperone
MRGRVLWGALVLVAGALLGVALVLVACRERGGTHGFARPTGEHFELIRLWKLIDDLELDQEQAVRLFPAWSRLQRQRQELMEQRRKAAEELADLLGEENAREEEVRSRMQALQALEEQLLEGKAAFQQEAAKVLDLRQQARLLLFEEHFRRDLRETVRAFRPGRENPPFWGQQERE